MKNKFYYKLLNIGKNDEDIELEIKSVIDMVIREARIENMKLIGLCRVVATNIAYEFDNRKIDYRIVNLADYNLYDHTMIISRTIVDDELLYYLIDPTFIQFDDYFPYKNLEKLDVSFLRDLIKKGYSKIDNNRYNIYFKSFEYDGKNMNVNDLFLGFKNKKKVN